MSKIVCSCCGDKPPPPIDWAARLRATFEKAKKDCAAGKHWLGLNPDLTPSTRCAWDFCDYGKGRLG